MSPVDRALASVIRDLLRRHPHTAFDELVESLNWPGIPLQLAVATVRYVLAERRGCVLRRRRRA